MISKFLIQIEAKPGETRWLQDEATIAKELARAARMIAGAFTTGLVPGVSVIREETIKWEELKP